MNPSWRNLVGIAAILLVIAGWSVLVVAGSTLVAGRPWPVQALYYLAAGIVWVLPLKPLIRWMQRGHAPQERR